METEILEPAAPERERQLRSVRESGDVLCTADLAECTCPDFCERDHEND